MATLAFLENTHMSREPSFSNGREVEVFRRHSPEVLPGVHAALMASALLPETPRYLLYAPIYWLFPRVETLLILQSLALAGGVLPLAAMILRRGGGRTAAIIFSLAWLLSPTLQNMNLENFHPEVLAAPFVRRHDRRRLFRYSSHPVCP